MMSTIQKIRTAWKLYRYGIFSILLNKLLLGYLRFQTFLFYSYNLKEEPLLKSPAIFMKRVESHQDELFQKFHQKFPAEEFVSRIQQHQQKCYVAVYDDEVVAYAWIAFEELFIDAINHSYTLGDDELFIYSCYVEKESRGSGIYPAMLRKILHDYHQVGTFRRAYIGVNAENAGSIRGIEKAGFRIYSKIRYKKWLTRERWKISQPYPAN